MPVSQQRADYLVAGMAHLWAQLKWFLWTAALCGVLNLVCLLAAADPPSTPWVGRVGTEERKCGGKGCTELERWRGLTSLVKGTALGMLFQVP